MRIAIVAFAAVLTAPLLAMADDTHAIASVTANQLSTPSPTGRLTRYAKGGGVNLTYLCGCDAMSFGGELGVMFLGYEDHRVYDFSLSFVVSANMKRTPVAPFMAVGLDLVGVEDPRLVDPPTVTTGVHGKVGVHGFASKNVYWRAYAGFLGAGPGGLTAGVGVGYLFGRGSL